METKRLELHHINVDGGEATLVLVVDDKNNTGTDTLVKSVLIDAGATRGGHAVLAKYVESIFLTRFGVQQDDLEIDIFIATHYHNDHIGGLVNAELTCKTVLDVGEMRRNRSDFYAQYAVVEAETDMKAVVDQYMDYVQGWDRIRIHFVDADNFDKKKKLKSEFMKPVEIDLDDDGEIKLYCVCALGALPNGTRVLTDQKWSKDRKINFNDQSLALIIRWENEDFTYFNAGDLTGDVDFISYYHVEEDLLDYLESNSPFKKFFPFSAIKTNHHGSWFSSYPSYTKTVKKQKVKVKGFIDRLDPTAVVTCCHLNLKDPLPHPTFVEDSLLPYLDERVKNKKETILAFANKLEFSSGPNKDALEKIRDKKYQQYVKHNLVDETRSIYTFLSNSYPISVILSAGRALPTLNSSYETDLSPKNKKFEVRQYFDSEMTKLGRKGVRPTRKSLYNVINDPVTESMIMNGFDGFSKLLGMLAKKDLELNESTAKDWMWDNLEAIMEQVPYPSKLSELSEFQSEADKIIKDLWDIFFEEKEQNNKYWTFTDQDVNATEVGEKTLEFLLVRNPFQPMLNFHIYQIRMPDEFILDSYPHGVRTEIFKELRKQLWSIQRPQKRSARLVSKRKFVKEISSEKQVKDQKRKRE